MTRRRQEQCLTWSIVRASNLIHRSASLRVHNKPDGHVAESRLSDLMQVKGPVVYETVKIDQSQARIRKLRLFGTVAVDAGERMNYVSHG